MNAEAKTAPSRLRLDELLVTRGFYQSRSRARDAVARGVVRVAGVPVTKPGVPVGEGVEITVEDPAARYVARSALKLIAGLDAFGVDPEGRMALDIGASTGGFTQVLLERGATKVFAIDVGHGQFDSSLRSDPRIVLREGLNARDLLLADLDGQAPDLLVCDVSFISLKLALPPALALAAPGARGVFLVKPQFEAGREAIGKGGLLKDPNVGPAIARTLAEWLETVPGWRVLGLHPSPIEGGDGNREFLLGAIKDRA
ncbi:TlyA family RNA methyltransferase [Pseudaminobacter sp. 19-2017]|uniref:TlyA family RNA methyltransferase n=1 Tax=Pseudaminobacter soli (ex Zhang et al. 2022) TaxID=2831468 RepID=A0A942I8I5_9HYPH|nr:TlyA family RNA methyltransferase [Pseudaminobacter soli]MBS3648261.1 TlyA family RNA methyltransferase [Pseudaminobacter soli]